MVSLMESIVMNRTVGEVALSWGVGPEQAARRLRGVPFVVLAHGEARRGGRGRPGRRVTLNPRWRFSATAGRTPLARLLRHLRTLDRLGEPFAVGVPLTSVHARPFLHPRVRLLAPPETFSVWKRLFESKLGNLTVVVRLLPDDARTVDVEGLPVLDAPWAAVDALDEYATVRNVNVLALADWLAHRTAGLAEARAAEVGLEGDLQRLADHRRRGGRMNLRAEEVGRAHEVAVEWSRMPAGVRFEELVARERGRP